jgi:penicillin-binding protein 1A
MTNNLIYKISKDILLDKELILKLISIEDKRFFKHNGIDLIRIVGATISNLKSFKIKEGASTLSQQVYDIKQQNITLKYNRKRNISRKIKQTIFALKYEQQESKENILKYYLENVYLGSDIFGFSKASVFYFNKSGINLNKKEIDFLLKRVKRPNDKKY